MIRNPHVFISWVGAFTHFQTHSGSADARAWLWGGTFTEHSRNIQGEEKHGCGGGYIKNGEKRLLVVKSVVIAQFFSRAK